MAEMATVPVFACRRCGKPVYITLLETKNDPGAEKLKDYMMNLRKIAICGNCQRVYNYLAQQDRTNEFLINPMTVIYNVVDNTELDYYGKNVK